MFSLLRKILKKIYDYYIVIQNHGQNNQINIATHKYRGKLNIRIYGNNNQVTIDSSCILNCVGINIWGDNNSIKIDDDAKIQIGDISLYNAASLNIEHNATFQGVSIVLYGHRCRIGADCMFSDGIKIRNYDGHKIIDEGSGEINNPPGDIVIEKHVWVGQDVNILKNSKIQEGSIIGCRALVSGEVGPHSIAVGIPAKVIKRGMTWIRH